MSRVFLPCAPAVHRNICQLLLEKGIFSKPELIDLLGDCIEKHKSEASRGRLKRKHDEVKDGETLDKVLQTINAQLQPLGLKVARMKSRDRESNAWETYYGVVNLNEEDGFGKQGWLSKSEQEFFHKLVDEILESESKQVEAVVASNMGRDLSATSKLSVSDAGKCLKRLEEGQWLTKSDEGYFSLGVRTELQRRYLSEERPKAADADADTGGTQEQVLE